MVLLQISSFYLEEAGYLAVNVMVDRRAPLDEAVAGKVVPRQSLDIFFPRAFSDKAVDESVEFLLFHGPLDTFAW